MFYLTLKNFGQSGKQSNLKNSLDSTGVEELDDAALRAVNGSGNSAGVSGNLGRIIFSERSAFQLFPESRKESDLSELYTNLSNTDPGSQAGNT